MSATPYRLPFAVLGTVVCLLLFALPVPPRGLWSRGYLANLPMPTPAAWSAPDRNPLSAPAPSRDGIGAYLDTICPGSQIPRASRELRRLPFRWARTEIPWAGVEPSPGRFGWKRWDRVVDTLREQDLEVLGMLCYWSGWVEPYSDEALRRFERYAETAARHYRGRISVWEIWNEPNNRSFWASSPERFVRLMRAGYAGVKRGNPEALVLGGSLSGVDVVYLRELLRHGAGQWMDALSIHPYGFGWLPEDAQLLEELRGVTQLMRDAGKRGGVWLTEIGSNTGSPKKRSQILERSAVLLKQSGVVEASFWFCLYSPTPDFNYSLYKPDWSPTPGLCAVNEVTRRLFGATPAGSGIPRDLQAPWGSGNPLSRSGLQVWCFRTTRGVTRVSWSPEGQVQLSIPGTPPRNARTVGAELCWEALPNSGGR